MCNITTTPSSHLLCITSRKVLESTRANRYKQKTPQMTLRLLKELYPWTFGSETTNQSRIPPTDRRCAHELSHVVVSHVVVDGWSIAVRAFTCLRVCTIVSLLGSCLFASFFCQIQQIFRKMVRGWTWLPPPSRITIKIYMYMYAYTFSLWEAAPPIVTVRTTNRQNVDTERSLKKLCKNMHAHEGMVANQNVVLILFPQVPKFYFWESKIFLSSEMMNYQPQYIQKRDIVDVQKIKDKHKTWAIQFNQKMPLYKDSCYSWTELNTDNSKIGQCSRDLLKMQFQYLFSFFLVLSATIPSCTCEFPYMRVSQALILNTGL